MDSPDKPAKEKSEASVGEPSGGLNPPSIPPGTPQGGFLPEDIATQRHAATARTLAMWLLIILGGSILLQYVSVVFLVYHNMNDGAKILEEIFHVWLPVLSGLAGSAVTFYFTKNLK